MADNSDLWAGYKKLHPPRTILLTQEEIFQCVSKPVIKPSPPLILKAVLPPQTHSICERCKKLKLNAAFKQRRGKRNKICICCKGEVREEQNKEKQRRFQKQKTKEKYHPTLKESLPSPDPQLQKICLYSYAPRNQVLKEIGYESYDAYCKSGMWNDIRQRVFDEKGERCVCCGRRAVQVHHRRYNKEDLLGETLEYLEPLCKHCHEKIEMDGNFKVSLEEANMRLYRFMGKIL